MQILAILNRRLKEAGVTGLGPRGLATDECTKSTWMDGWMDRQIDRQNSTAFLKENDLHIRREGN